MKDVDQFALWLAGATLRGSGHDVDAVTVGELANQVEQTGDLRAELEAMRQFDRRGGDIGLEFVGALIIPILIEAGKQLWTAYAKKLTDEAGSELGQLTTDKIKALVRQRWAAPVEDSRAAFERLLRAEAAKQSLSVAQTEALVNCLYQEHAISAITG